MTTRTARRLARKERPTQGLPRRVRPLVGPVAIGLLGFACLGPVRGADVGQRFASVQAFVASLPEGSAELGDRQYGDLAGAGRRDWAGVVLMQDPEFGRAERVAVLVQQADGSYRVAAQSALRSTNGGTAHHGLDEVSIQRGSLFVHWSWNWHGCGGSSVQQVKFHKHEWRVIGAEITRAAAVETADGYDAGDSITISHDLLTGDVVVRLKPADGPAETTRSRVKPERVLLDDSFDEDTGGVDGYSSYAIC